MKAPPERPIWFNGKDILEAVFCEEFMGTHKLTCEKIVTLLWKQRIG